MPLRAGELCEGCHKHIHPHTEPSKSHPLPACDLCLPPGHILLTCGGCKLTRYCGKVCQKGHRAAHKGACEGNIWAMEWAKSYGPEVEAKYRSFARWCGDNNQAFSNAALNALEIFSPLDRQRAYEYVLFVVVRTENDGKSRFDHSIVTASKKSRQSLHDKLDIPMGIFYKDAGGPEAVEKFFLPSSGSEVKIVLQNVNLPPPVNLYTLLFNIDEKFLHKEYDPDWFKHLGNRVK